MSPAIRARGNAGGTGVAPPRTAVTFGVIALALLLLPLLGLMVRTPWQQAGTLLSGSIRSTASGWDAVADELLPAALALADERDRLRRCGNPRCRWLFVDRSRQGNRIWCEAAVCGNRMRVGRHRGRPVDATEAAATA